VHKLRRRVVLVGSRAPQNFGSWPKIGHFTFVLVFRLVRPASSEYSLATKGRLLFIGNFFFHPAGRVAFLLAGTLWC
jgi:hypothetical protein